MSTNDPQAPYTVKLNGHIEAVPIPFDGMDLSGLPDDIVREIRNMQGIHSAFAYPPKAATAPLLTRYEKDDDGMQYEDDAGDFVLYKDVQDKIASGDLMSRSDALLRHLIEVLDENPMIEDTYPRMTELRAKIIEAETK